jgi:hypothetical protein
LADANGHRDSSVSRAAMLITQLAI